MVRRDDYLATITTDLKSSMELEDEDISRLSFHSSSNFALATGLTAYTHVKRSLTLQISYASDFKIHLLESS